MEVIEGGKQPFRKGEPVVVEGRSATVVCARFTTHVFRGLVSVDYGAGEFGLVEEDQVYKAKATGPAP